MTAKLPHIIITTPSVVSLLPSKKPKKIATINNAIKAEEHINLRGRKLTVARKKDIQLHAPFSPFKACKIEVRCINNELHTIALTIQGDLVLHNHNKADIDAFQAFKALGAGGRCRCLTIKKYWVRCCSGRHSLNINNIPEPLRSEAVKAVHRGAKRRERVRKSKDDQLDCTLISRTTIVARLFKKIIPQCDTADSNKVKVKINIVGNNHKFDKILKSVDLIVKVPPLSLNRWSPLRTTKHTSNYTRSWGYSIFIQMTTTDNWYTDVYKKGIALIEGLLVTKMYWDNSTGYSYSTNNPNTRRSYPIVASAPLKKNQYLATLVQIGSSKSATKLNAKPINANMWLFDTAVIEYNHDTKTWYVVRLEN